MFAIATGGLVWLLLQGSSTGLTPLTDFKPSQTYKGENGGLYGKYSNVPPSAHRSASLSESTRIVPRGADGQPNSSGRIVLISIGMSNTTQEFSVFRQRANADPEKSEKVIIVDCAQGGMTAADWGRTDSVRPRSTNPWKVMLQRLETAGVTPLQVQAAWVKLAQRNPASLGEFPLHARSLRDDTVLVLNQLKQHCPNLRIVYFSSRIYAGYATTPLNPEPYAYESAFAMRWLIRDQIAGDPALNWNPNAGAVRSPLLLWGPYLWADGVKGRAIDALVWLREDFANDGTHPSQSGREKVASLLLHFFKTDVTTRPWFVRNP